MFPDTFDPNKEGLVDGEEAIDIGQPVVELPSGLWQRMRRRCPCAVLLLG